MLLTVSTKCETEGRREVALLLEMDISHLILHRVVLQMFYILTKIIPSFILTGHMS